MNYNNINNNNNNNNNNSNNNLQASQLMVIARYLLGVPESCSQECSACHHWSQQQSPIVIMLSSFSQT